MSGIVLVTAAVAALTAILHRRRLSRLRLLKILSVYLRRRRLLDNNALPPPLIAKPVKLRHSSDFLALFRFTREQFMAVLEAYHLPEYVRCDVNIRVCRWDALGIVLYRLAHPGAMKLLEEPFGRRVRTLRSIFYTTIEMLFAQCQTRLQRPSRAFLNDERLIRYCTAIANKGAPYAFMFGFIDGSVYQICRPKGDTLWQRSIYNGYKSYHGFKWQGLNTPDGLIQFLYGPISARYHDITLLRASKLAELLRLEFRVPAHLRRPDYPEETHFCIYGDPGATLSQ